MRYIQLTVFESVNLSRLMYVVTSISGAGGDVRFQLVISSLKGGTLENLCQFLAGLELEYMEPTYHGSYILSGIQFCLSVEA